MGKVQLAVRALFIGDIVGKPGVGAVRQQISDLRREMKLDLVIGNAENAADGSGLTRRQFKQLTEDDCLDVITMGDHVFRKSEIYETLNQDQRIVRPANFPNNSPGRGFTTIKLPSGVSVTVINLLGRVFMRPVDCPFQAVDQILAKLGDAPAFGLSICMPKPRAINN